MQTKPTHRAGFLLYKKKKKKKDKWKICYAFPTWPKFPEVKGFRLLWTLHFSYFFAAHCFHMMPMRVWHHNMIISGTSCSSSREEEHKYLVWNWHNGNPLGVPFLVMWNFFLFCCLQQTLKHTLHTFSSTQTHLYSSTLGNQLHKDKRFLVMEHFPSQHVLKAKNLSSKCICLNRKAEPSAITLETSKSKHKQDWADILQRVLRVASSPSFCTHSLSLFPWGVILLSVLSCPDSAAQGVHAWVSIPTHTCACVYV